MIKVAKLQLQDSRYVSYTRLKLHTGQITIARYIVDLLATFSLNCTQRLQFFKLQTRGWVFTIISFMWMLWIRSEQFYRPQKAVPPPVPYPDAGLRADLLRTIEDLECNLGLIWGVMVLLSILMFFIQFGILLLSDLELCGFLVFSSFPFWLYFSFLCTLTRAGLELRWGGNHEGFL